MAARNTEPYIGASVQSVLGQTLRDLELLVLDDASTDATGTILDGLARRDGRVRLFRNARQLGVARSLNFLAGEAQSPLCARMDADDLAHPDRLRRQWEVLEAQADVLLVGTLWEGIDRFGRLVRPRDRWRLWRRSATPPFPAGCVMFRRNAFRAIEGYRGVPWEDVDLALRMARRGRVDVLPDALYRYRFHVESASQRHGRELMLRSLQLMRRCVALDRAGQDYAPLLRRIDNGAAPDGAPGVEATYLLEASRVWAGHAPTPGAFRGPAVFRWSRAAVKLRVFLAAARVSPRMLRRFLGAAIGVRDWVAGWFLRDGMPVEWRRP